MKRAVIRYSAKGQGVVIGIGLIVGTLIFSALCVDTGFYFVSHNTLQTAADSAALGAVKELYINGAQTPEGRQAAAKNVANTLASRHDIGQTPIALNTGTDVQFGYIDPDTKTYDKATFLTASNDPSYNATGGFNAVRVIARKSAGSANGALPTIMATLFGVNSMNAEAVSVAMLDNAIVQVNTGLRPIYGCMEQYQQVLQLLQDNPGTALGDYTVSMYGPTFGVEGVVVNACPASLNGNWGFADFANSGPNGPGVNVLGDWFGDGYDGTVAVPDPVFSTQPGGAGSSTNITSPLQNLIDTEEVVLIPLLTQWDGQGSNTQAHVGGFAGFVFDSYKFNNKVYPNDGNNGPTNGPDYIKGHFVNVVCAQGQGVCQTGSATTGASVVNLRLAL